MNGARLSRSDNENDLEVNVGSGLTFVQNWYIMYIQQSPYSNQGPK